MLPNSKAQLIQSTTPKVGKKLLEQFTDQMKKAKKVNQKVEIELSINGNTKGPQM